MGKRFCEKRDVARREAKHPNLKSENAMNLQDVLQSIKTAAKEIKSRANSALSGLGVIDQIEQANEVRYALSSLKYVEETIAEVFSSVDELLTKFPEVSEEVAASVIAAKIEAGEIVKAADADTALVAARKEAKAEGAKEAGDEFAAEKLRMKNLHERRGEVATDHGAEVAAAIPEEVILSEDWAAAKLEIGRRVKALDEVGVKANEKPEGFSEFACSAAFDEDGGKAFDKRVGVIRDMVAASRSPGATGTGAASRKAGAVPPVTTPRNATKEPAEDGKRKSLAAF